MSAEATSTPPAPSADIQIESKTDFNDLGQKVFVGNLAFSTTNQTLTDAFNNVAKVKEARVLTRGRRSLGYGFVVFEDDVDLDSAISSLNKMNLGGREINVEAARPIDKDRAPRAPRHPRAPRSHNEGDVDESKASSFNNRRSNSHKTDENDADQPPRPRRQPRERRRQIDSETMVFVANLPFSTRNENLRQLFADFDVTEARVALSIMPRRAPRSRGFGFVTFSSHEEQLRALNATSETPLVLENRELSVKPALAAESQPEAETKEAAEPSA
ncbi:Single-stranded TG1-3 DNA-binding protein [Smittium mucronatum]|uniref:Single-stranded TG1-3 DNA-binding protein n=1 Tax=Smittium mucronatum TaxID=133383 RepID=A0A1R0H3U9_9FUNG|nr:Single-stranded TG1-3 DNA-binding protein [Smittium mucronatum]